MSAHYLLLATRLIGCFIWLAAILTFSTAAHAETGAAGADDAAALYRLAPGDRLAIKVFGHDDLAGEFDIDAEGQINFPLLGPVGARGASVGELKETLRVALDRDYIVNPRVSVEVLNYRPFYILGQVTSPGSYPYTAGMNLRQAVALAGGYTRRASTSSMTLQRVGENGERIEIEAEEDTPILPGDTIEVDRRIF